MKTAEELRKLVQELIRDCDEPIPIYVAYAMNLEPPTAQDIRWAQSLGETTLKLVK